jgi:hypothetical protein
MARFAALLVALTLLLAPALPRSTAAQEDQGPSSSASASGTVTLRFFACGAGIYAQGVARASCSPTDRTPGLQIFELGSRANLRDINEANRDGLAYTWYGLPDGEYLLNARALPYLFDRFYVAGLDGINAPPERGYTAGPNEGYIIPINAQSGREWTLSVYLIREYFAVDVGFRFWQCPPGVVAQPDMTGLGCEAAPVLEGFGIDLTRLDRNTLEPLGEPNVTLAEADLADPMKPILRTVWPGPWILSGTPPEGLYGFAMRADDPRLIVMLKEDRSGYDLFVDAIQGGVAWVDVYLLAPPE